MKATDANLLSFMNSAPQFVIPIYQRTYSWTERECRQLWDDVRCAGRSDHIPVHFLGSVVYVEESLSNTSSRSPLLVIDGQQRLTSVTLLLAALSRVVADGEPVDGFSFKKIRNRYLQDPDETGERAFKLLLSKTDRTTLNAIVAGDDPRQMAVDVTDIGRWGNGNSEVKLSDPEDLPYVVGLIRQALDRQFSSEEIQG